MESTFQQKKIISTHNIDREKKNSFFVPTHFLHHSRKKKRLFLFSFFLSLLFVEFIRRLLNIFKALKCLLK
jgi:hypothetical protein